MTRNWKNKLEARFPFIAAFILAIIGLAAFLGYYHVHKYEQSVLRMYSNQQDNYVQLVLDQINLQKDNANEEDIIDILATLDTSGRKYWTLTKDQSLVFVKNVTETNRYKGFTTATYYVSESAGEFLESLERNRVIHRVINIDGDRYVASGVKFGFNGSNYKVCLLTGETVILEQNDFLSAKTALMIYLAVLLIAFLMVLMISAKVIYDDNIVKIDQKKKIRWLNRDIQKLTKRIRFSDSYHSRWNTYEAVIMPIFVRKLLERKVKPVSFVRIKFNRNEGRRKWLNDAQMLLDDRVLRFSGQDGELLLMMLEYDEEAAINAVGKISYHGHYIVNSVTYHGQGEDLTRIYRDFIQSKEA